MSRSTDIRLTLTPGTARQLLVDLEHVQHDRVLRYVDEGLTRWPGEVIVLTITDTAALVADRGSESRWRRLLTTGRKVGLLATTAPDAGPIPVPFWHLVTPADEVMHARG